MAIVPLLRRGSTRTRFGSINNLQSTSSNHDLSGSGTLRPRDATTSTTATTFSSNIQGRGRPRKSSSAASPVLEEHDRPRRSRGRPPKIRDETEELDSSSDIEEPQSPSDSMDAINESLDIDMEVDQPGSGSPGPMQTERLDRKDSAPNAIENDDNQTSGEGGEEQNQSRGDSQTRGRSSTSGVITKSNSQSRSRSRNSDDQTRTVSRSRSETPSGKQERAESSRVSEDREGDDGSSASDDEDADADSDDGRRGTEPLKEKRPKAERLPTKRRLRSSKRIPDVVAHLTADADGLDMDHLLSDFTDEQQQLKATTSAAAALTRLFRQSIQDSENLHPDMVDAQDYELIRHTFGDIDDLNLNLTGTMSMPDESNSEDDDLTKDLKRDHRAAKKVLYDICAEFKEAKTSMRIRMNADLDAEESQIRAGTHPGLLAELKAIEDRRKSRVDIAKAQKDYSEQMWEKNYQAIRKAAFDQYKAGLIDTRRVMIDLVQSRMDRIKQEMDESNKLAEKANIKTRALTEALVYRNTVLLGHADSDYDSCDESCSSYDSYSSSGSECSDCEICISAKHSKAPRLTAPQGLNNKEVAADLAFLFPEDPPRRSSVPDDAYSSMEQIVSQQQYRIDQINEERRKRRRIYDREMQNMAIYKKSSDQSADIRMGSGSPNRDMDVDQERDELFEQQMVQSKYTKERLPRTHSPVQGIQYRSTPDVLLSRPTKDHQPRFIPGFGPNGPERASPKGELKTGYLSRYPLTDRYSRPWDAHRAGMPDPRGYHQPLPPPIGVRDASRTYGSPLQYDANSHERNDRLEDSPQETRQYFMPPRSRQQEHYRSRYELDPAYGPHYSQSIRHPSDPSGYYTNDPRAYPYDDPRGIVPPRKRPPMPSPQSEAPGYPSYVRAPRGRPPKNPRITTWVDPTTTLVAATAVPPVPKLSPYSQDNDYNKVGFPTSPPEGPGGVRYNNGVRTYPSAGYFSGYRTRESNPPGDHSPSIPHVGGHASPQDRVISTASSQHTTSRSHPLPPLSTVSRPAYPPGSYPSHLSPHHMSHDHRRSGPLAPSSYPPPGTMRGPGGGGYGGPPPPKNRGSPIVIDLSSEPNSPVMSPRPKELSKSALKQDNGSPRISGPSKK
ncbi:hypothetical protein FBU30_009765 [Linnemannia zychae]|nr:hypothetical protein FBU30_009765 [Linnemannia zychae]